MTNGGCKLSHISTHKRKAVRKNRPFSYSTKEPGSSVIFIHKVRLSGVRASIAIEHIRKFYRM